MFFTLTNVSKLLISDNTGFHMINTLSRFIIVLIYAPMLVAHAQAETNRTFYISLTGDDQNSGLSTDSALATFEHALELLKPGDILEILPGVYEQRVDLDAIGTPAKPIVFQAHDPQQKPVFDFSFGDEYFRVEGENWIIKDIEVRNAFICLRVTGRNVTISGVDVHQCDNHGVLLQGKNLVVENSRIYLTNLRNRLRDPNEPSWGSGLKVGVDGDNLVLRNNEVFNNYGEGIAVTRGTNVQVLDNIVYDNYTTQIYIDNSYHVLVEGNYVYCTDETDFDYHDGTESFAIGLGEEEYDRWGARLGQVTIINNITDSCGKGIGYFAVEVPESGLDNIVIAHNTFWNSDTISLLIVHGENPQKTRNTIIANNIFDGAIETDVWVDDRTGIDMFNNLWVDGEPDEWLNATGPNDVVGDPGFIITPTIPDMSTYQPGVESPAIGNAGLIPGYVVSKDFADRARTIPTDIGAVIYAGSS